MLALPLALVRGGTLAESDTFWQVRTGLQILSTHHIPTHDSFSWTVPGRPWSLNSWGFDVVAALAYRTAGLRLVGVLSSALVLLVALAILLLARRLGASPAVAGLVLAAASPLVLAWMSARPQTVDFAAVPLLLVLLLSGRRVLTLAGVAGLQAAWANLHAAAPLGVAVVALALAPAAAAALRRRAWVALRWPAAVVLAAAAGTLMTPLGLSLVTHAQQVGAASSGLVVEWRHLAWSNPGQVALLGLGVGGLVVTVRHRWLVLSGPLALLLAAGIDAVRFLPILFAVGVAPLAAQLSRPTRCERASLLRLATLSVVAGVVVVGLAPLAVRGLRHPGRLAGTYPVSAVRALPAGCRVLNDYLVGGYVILTRPDVPVSLDSRNDLYGKAEVRRVDALLAGGGPDPAAAVEASGATCVLTAPGSRLAGALAGDRGWRLVFRDGSAAVLAWPAGVG